MRRPVALAILVALLGASRPAEAQRTDSLRARFVDAELRTVVQALGQYLDKPLIAAALPPDRVTIDYPGSIPRTGVAAIIRGLLSAHSLSLVEESEYFTIVADRGAAAPAAVITPGAVVQLFTVRLRHARAADVAATLNLLFEGGGPYVSDAGTLPGTLSESLRQNLAPLSIADTVRAPDSAAVAPRRLRGTLAGPATIVPDELTNTLLVRATEADFAVLTGAIDQLDVRPLQVLVEVLIVEARRDRSFDLGVALEVARERGSTTTGISLSGAGPGDLILSLMTLGRLQVDGLLAAASQRGDIDIVSRPALVVSNNTEGRLLVGSQRPFVQISRSLPTETAARDQVVQYKDVGTKLLIRPTINQDGYVSLLLQQEISAATTETQFGAPVISTREARTQVLVRDGQTLVVGGLADEQRERARSGVPILSALPLVGGLFGRSRRSTSSTELYLFLTPRILRNDQDADAVTAPHLPPGPARR